MPARSWISLTKDREDFLSFQILILIIKGDSDENGTDDNDGDWLSDDTTDANQDGLIDAYEPDLGVTPLNIVDSNGDGLPDRLDASKGKGGGCALASKGETPVSSLIYLLIPAFVLCRKAERKINNY